MKNPQILFTQKLWSEVNSLVKGAMMRDGIHNLCRFVIRHTNTVGTWNEYPLHTPLECKSFLVRRESPDGLITWNRSYWDAIKWDVSNVTHWCDVITELPSQEGL